MERIFFKGLRENSCKDDLEIYFQRYFLENIKLSLSRYQIQGEELQSIIELMITPQVAYFLNSINISFKTTISVLKIIPTRNLTTIILSGVPQNISLYRLFGFALPITPGLINLTEIDIPGDDEKKEILAEYENHECAYAAYEYFQNNTFFQKSLCKVYLKDPDLDIQTELNKFSNVISVEDIPATHNLDLIRKQFETFGRVIKMKQVSPREVFIQYDLMDREAPKKAIDFFSKFNQFNEIHEGNNQYLVQPASIDSQKKNIGREEFLCSYNMLPENEKKMIQKVLLDDVVSVNDSHLDTFFNAKATIGNLTYRLDETKKNLIQDVERAIVDCLIEEGVPPKDAELYLPKIIHENKLVKASAAEIQRFHMADQFNSIQIRMDSELDSRERTSIDYGRQDSSERNKYRERSPNSPGRKRRSRRKSKRSRSRNKNEPIGPEPPSNYFIQYIQRQPPMNPYPPFFQYDNAPYM